jgi:uncharacterized protein YndB with AHSA1/START domain
VRDFDMEREMLHRVVIAAPATTVYTALTTKAGTAGYWTADCDVPEVEGEVARFGFPSAPVDLRMQITTLRRDERVAWECLGDFPYWAGTTIEFDVAAGDDGGTVLAFRHGGFGDEYPDEEYGLVNFTWGQILGRLRGYCQTGEPQPEYP